ncbi:MAG: DUF2254 domain-containing protein [Nocardiopsaceae bacterium]|nr:DUF2254 domain-containing protein [Nocardiopsaceae bacterium]
MVGAMLELTGFVVTVTVLAIQMATWTFSARYMRIWCRDPCSRPRSPCWSARWPSRARSSANSDRPRQQTSRLPSLAPWSCSAWRCSCCSSSGLFAARSHGFRSAGPP